MPVVLPLVIFEAHDADRLVVTVNGDKRASTPVRRDAVGRVLTELVTGFGVPTRVEIHERDGSVVADIVQPPPKPVEPEPSESVEREATRRRRRVPELVELQAAGFVPGEDVAVAVVLRHGSAGPEGLTRALIDRAELGDLRVDEVVLLGRISGTTAVRPLT